MNTKLFHVSATMRKKRNKIVKLCNEKQNMVEDQPGLCEVARDYFNKLFCASQVVYDPIIGIVEQKITIEDNQLLLAPFSDTEFRDAMPQMHSDKALEPDGQNPAL